MKLDLFFDYAEKSTKVALLENEVIAGFEVNAGFVSDRAEVFLVHFGEFFSP